MYKLKEYFKNDEIIINGGIKSTEEIKNHLVKVDGAMIGRAVYHSPYFLAEIEKDIFKNDDVPTRRSNGKINSLYSRRNNQGRTIKPHYETYGWFISRTKWIKSLETIFV